MTHSFNECVLSPKCVMLNEGLVVPTKSVKSLQLVQNTAARVLTRTRKRDHISPVLASLHWLPVKSRIEFKIVLLTYKALNGQAPSYRAYSSLLPHKGITLPKFRVPCGSQSL